MSEVKHNKKRNVGIIYELLLREISSDIVDEGGSSAKAGVLLRKHFKKGTELHKEFRLFNALVRTQASSPAVAMTILSEAKKLARDMNPKQLDIEKTELIHNINRTLDKERFYGRWLPEYREFATIQILLNDWRGEGLKNISRQAEFEEQVKTWLIKERRDPRADIVIDPNVDNLVLTLMEKKFDKKFGNALTEQQKNIMRAYVLSETTNDKTTFSKFLEELKEETIASLDAYLIKENNAVLNEKATSIRSDVVSLPTDSFDDKVIVRYLTVSQLKSTLEEGHSNE
jgi:hypothetical protein